MTKKELWERLATMKGQFGFIGNAVRHKRKRTYFKEECCPLSALVEDLAERTNNPSVIAAALGLTLDFACDFAKAADNTEPRPWSNPKLQKLRKKILRTLGLKEFK